MTVDGHCGSSLEFNNKTFQSFVMSPLRSALICSRIIASVRRNATVSSYSSDFPDTPVALAYDDYGPGVGSPLLISHGMLGSRQNWTSLAKQIHRSTGRRVITVDARNHGESPHTEQMSYHSMAGDIHKLIHDLSLDNVTLVGHSMGGRSSMLLALEHSGGVKIDNLVVVDISPVNQTFDVTSSTEWNMEHYFHCLKSVSFTKGQTMSQTRKQADKQLAQRIQDPGLRAWLLMNLKQDDKTGEIDWRINIDTIHKAFKKSIAVFPTVLEGTMFNKPTLFIGGSESDYIPVADHYEIEEQFPMARFEYVEGAGHWVHSQKPKEFLLVLQKFLQEH